MGDVAGVAGKRRWIGNTIVDPYGGIKIEYSTTTDPKVTPMTRNDIEAVYDMRPRNRAERRVLRYRPASVEARALMNRTVLRQSIGSYLD